MVIVITGGAGFLGFALAEKLARRHTVYVIDTNPLPPWSKTTTVRYLRANIGEFSKFFDCDVIIHAASPVGPVGLLNAGGEIGPEIIQGSRQVISWALAKKSQLIFISSSEVYGRAGQLTEDSECSYSGSDPSIRNEYAQAKLLSEIMIANTAKLQPDFYYQIVRPFNIAGPRQLPANGFVLPRFTIQALSGCPLTVYGDGSQRRAFTHVKDVTEGIIAITEATQEHYNKIWNIGNPANTIALIQLAGTVCRMAKRGSIKCCDPRELHGPWFTECDEKLPDIGRIQSLLGWKPTISLDGIVSETLEFWSENARYLEYQTAVCNDLDRYPAMLKVHD